VQQLNALAFNQRTNGLEQGFWPPQGDFNAVGLLVEESGVFECSSLQAQNDRILKYLPEIF